MISWRGFQRSGRWSRPPKSRITVAHHMFCRLKWQRLKDPIVTAGASLAVLSWIGIGLVQPSVLAIGAGCLASLLIVSASVRIAWASQRLALGERRLRNSRRRISQQWQSLNAARHEAEAANRAKRDFYASLSHELRTPLNGILGMSQAVLGSELGAPQRQSIQTIAASSEALLVIVNDILDYAKIEAGKLELRPDTFDLRQLLQDLIGLVSAGHGADHRVGIDLAYAPGLPVWFTADAGRIRQIVTNLLGNAVKFSRGRVSVTVARSGPGELRISVTDTGPGIPVDRLAAIFDEYVQLDSPVLDPTVNGTPAGTGLGLPISKRLATLLGGEIHVMSEVGIGSTFTLKLPLPSADPGLTAGSDRNVHNVPPVTSPARQRIAILAAEDNKTNRHVLASMLRSENVELSLACDGREAVAMFLQSSPGLILMDVSMPGMNGFEATARIRNLERLHGLGRTPIVALTANAVRGDRDKCLAADMDDYMSKPLLKKVLLTAIGKWGHREQADDKPLFDQDRRQAGNTRRSVEGDPATWS